MALGVGRKADGENNFSNPMLGSSGFFIWMEKRTNRDGQSCVLVSVGRICFGN